MEVETSKQIHYNTQEECDKLSMLVFEGKSQVLAAQKQRDELSFELGKIRDQLVDQQCLRDTQDGASTSMQILQQALADCKADLNILQDLVAERTEQLGRQKNDYKLLYDSWHQSNSQVEQLNEQLNTCQDALALSKQDLESCRNALALAQEELQKEGEEPYLVTTDTKRTAQRSGNNVDSFTLFL